jgi:hypothetical protein
MRAFQQFYEEHLAKVGYNPDVASLPLVVRLTHTILRNVRASCISLFFK